MTAITRNRIRWTSTLWKKNKIPAPPMMVTRTVRGNDAREWLDCWPQGCGLVVPGACVAWPAHVLPVGRDRVKPEQWHSKVLHDYAEQLMAAVQMLAHQEGYHDGLAEARVVL